MRTDEYVDEHKEILELLARAENAAGGDGFQEALARLAPAISDHLLRKEERYLKAREAFEESGDASTAKLLSIFEQNMQVLSEGVRRYFSDVTTADPDSLAAGFPTIANVVRSRLQTEEMAILPLFERCADKLGAMR